MTSNNRLTSRAEDNQIGSDDVSSGDSDSANQLATLPSLVIVETSCKNTEYRKKSCSALYCGLGVKDPDVLTALVR
jgi:hypothetical protein